MPDTTRDVLITGLGPVSAVGVGIDAFWSGLDDGTLRTSPRTLIVDLGKTIELPIVSMPPSDQVPGLSKHEAALTDQGYAGYRDLAYALLAMELALADAKLVDESLRNSIGVVQAFEAPGVENTVTQLFNMFSGPPPTAGPPPVYDMLAPYFYNMQPFLYVHILGKILGLRGFSTSVHNACASGAFALEIAAQHIRSGQAEVMIVVGAEAFDTGVRLEWFRRLELYALDPMTMRPFDSSSTGFFVGEGGAAIILEAAEHAARRGATPYARYRGGAFVHQGWKQVIPDVRAARLKDVILRALDSSEVPASDIDLIVPHGAGTTLSDGYEAACLAGALNGAAGSAVGAVFKPAVGHLLAASGIMDTLCSLLAMKHQHIPASPWRPRDPTSFPVPLTTAANHKIDTILKLATGFTGHDAALLFDRPIR